MKSKKDLIAQISQNLAAEPAAQAATPVADVPQQPQKPVAKPREPEPAAKSEPADRPSPTGSGKQAAFWLDDEDRAIFHETGMLLYSQGIKPSHNLVLRAAIRMIPRDHRLVEKVRELIEKDGRKVRHQKK